MASEESPLLKTRDNATAYETVYDRFTPHQKRWILFVVSCAGLLPSEQSASTGRAILMPMLSISGRSSDTRAFHPSDGQRSQLNSC